MAKRGSSAPCPIYRCLYSQSGSHPTCVIAGEDRHHVWLNVYNRTPMVLRLHPQVVHFLQSVLTELDARAESPVVDLGVVYRRLERDTTVSYPELLVMGRLHKAVWLNVYAATPSSLLLVPPVVQLLRTGLAGLPSRPARYGHEPGVIQ